MIDDSERRLAQVASLVNAIGRAENVSAPAVFAWLLQQSEGGLQLPRLWMPGRTPPEKTRQASAEESAGIWRSLAKRAESMRLDEQPMPLAASSWFVHAKDVLALLDQDFGWTDAARAELQALAARHLPPLRRSTTATPPAVTLPDAPIAPSDASPSRDRGLELKKEVLVKEHKHQWPTILDDLNHAAANGLRDAARAPTRGYWWEADALAWARSRGKLSGTAGASALQAAWQPSEEFSPRGGRPRAHDEE